MTGKKSSKLMLKIKGNEGECDMRDQPASMSLPAYVAVAPWRDGIQSFSVPRSDEVEGDLRTKDRFLQCARRLLKARKEMAGIFPKDVFRDSAWDIVLELYVGAIEGHVIYVKQAVIASGECPATAVRMIARLEKAGFLEREMDDDDHRRNIVRISEIGRQAIEVMLNHIGGSSAATKQHPFDAATALRAGQGTCHSQGNLPS